MPRLLETRTRTDALLVAAVQLICRGGLRALTLRAVAAESRVSGASIIHHFGNRARMDRVLGRTFGHRWIDQISLRSLRRGVHAFLPEDEEELVAARVWLAWLELGRTDPALAANLAGIRGRHRELLDVLTGRTFDEVDLDLLVAVVEGLVAATCAPGDPMTPERARAALERYQQLRSAS
jgi:AcrR family transcriptional regulator